MGIAGILWRFAVVYAALLFTAGLIESYFNLDLGSGLNTGLLLGTMIWLCESFAVKNKRYFMVSEKIKVVVGCATINLGNL